MVVYYNNEKLSTGIDGLDSLLYGGLQLQYDQFTHIVQNPYKKHDPQARSFTGIAPFHIMIDGEVGTSKALWGLLLLQGLTKSLRRLTKEVKGAKKLSIGNPVFCSQSISLRNAHDMLIDMLISKSMSQMAEEHIVNPELWMNNDFSDVIFDLSSPLKGHVDVRELDKYLSEGKVIFNNRTDQLHIVSFVKENGMVKERIGDPVANRKDSTIKEYAEALKDRQDNPVFSNFFDVDIYDDVYSIPRCNEVQIPCLLVDGPIPNDFNIDKIYPVIVIRFAEDIDTVKEPDYRPNMIIDLRHTTHPAADYAIRQLSIKKSVLQQTAHGWHLYKVQDCGIEVYPSAHTITYRRRNMPKGVLASHIDALSKTYSQYLDNEIRMGDGSSVTDAVALQNFEKSCVDIREQMLVALTDSMQTGGCASAILNKILVLERGESDVSHVTAIIGEPNTYKR